MKLYHVNFHGKIKFMCSLNWNKIVLLWFIKDCWLVSLFLYVHLDFCRVKKARNLYHIECRDKECKTIYVVALDTCDVAF